MAATIGDAFYIATHLELSMSRRGNCWDNAVTEHFFSGLKKERIRKCIYKTQALAKAYIFDYIDAFYSQTWHHSCLGDFILVAFERESD